MGWIHSWLQILGNLEVAVYLLVGGAVDQVVPGLVSAYWWVRLSLRATAGSLLSVAGSQCLGKQSPGGPGVGVGLQWAG